MKLGPRAKLVAIAALFALPIAASLIVYHFFPPPPSGHYGELLPATTVTSQTLGREGGASFKFADLQGKWLLVASDSGACAEACVEKLTAMRQVRLALGRRAERIERVFVVDDLKVPDRAALGPFAGTVVATTPPGMALPPSATNDRAHIYVVDPRGRVMMRFPTPADRKRMLRDLERLLRASQIG